jgi:hypothetical protein
MRIGEMPKEPMPVERVIWIIPKGSDLASAAAWAKLAMSTAATFATCSSQPS